MATQSDEFKITRLSAEKSNYHSWSIRTKAALISKGIWEAIDPGFGAVMSDAQRKQNEKALSFLFLLVEDNFLDDIGSHSKAKDAWETLCDMHTKYGLLHILQLLRDFFNINKRRDEKMQMYLGRIMDLHRKLEACSYGFQDREVALIMLMGLPKNYEHIILNLEHDINAITTQLVKARLALEEKRQVRNEEEELERQNTNDDFGLGKALVIRNRSKDEEKGHFKSRKPKNDWKNHHKGHDDEKATPSNTRFVRCFCCGTFGHIANECPEKEALKANERTKKNTAKKVQLCKEEETLHKALCLGVTNVANLNKDIWFLDSGATDHMSSRKTRMTNFSEVTSAVEVANKDIIRVEGKGQMKFHPLSGMTKYSITLDDVLYVPELDGNLLSVGRIEEMGHSVVFNKGEAKIIQADGEVILTAIRDGRLYKIQEDLSLNITKMVKTVDEELWHRRLGHLNKKALGHLLKSEDVSQKKGIEMENCRTCMLGKIRRKPFPKGQATRAKRPLELIHSDVVGKITPMSKGGANYVVTFIDDFTRHTSVYFMKKKSQVLEKFNEFKRRSENCLDLKIEKLRTDNGEYLSNNFDEYLVEHGITRQLTIPGTPQQNGVAERANQTLMDATRCMLIESGLPRHFWADAMNTACYIRNRCPTKSLDNKTPEEMWIGEEVAIHHMIPFGCRVWSVRSKLDKRSKLDPKGEETVFIGYPEGVKGYKLWNFRTNKIFVSKDVIVEENIYPLRKTDDLPKENENTVLEEGEEVLISFEEDPPIQENPSGSDNNSEDEISSNAETLPIIEEELRRVKTNQMKQSTVLKDIPVTTREISTTATTSKPKEVLPIRRSERIANRKAKSDAEVVLHKTLIMKERRDTIDNNNLEKDPVTVKQAMNRSDANLWKEAMTEEMNNLKENQTWELVPRPPNRRIISSKWVFRRKLTKSRELERYKARLVARGYNQVYGIDYTDTYSPVLKMKSLRLLLALAASWGWTVKQLDITAAYLHGTLTEDIYMEQPEFFEEDDKQDWVCHLKRSIYGLKQSGRQWNECFDNFMKSTGLKRSKADPCIYYDCEKGIMAGVYVDDTLIITRNDEVAEEFIKTI